MQNPNADIRFQALCDLIEQLVHRHNQWIDDERLIVFTEYKTTLDYLIRRLREAYPAQEDRFLCLYGEMKQSQRRGDVQVSTRDQIIHAFNDPQANVRVLLATDVAAEGLNLQSTTRYLLQIGRAHV